MNKDTLEKIMWRNLTGEKDIKKTVRPEKSEVKLSIAGGV